MKLSFIFSLGIHGVALGLILAGSGQRNSTLLSADVIEILIKPESAGKELKRQISIHKRPGPLKKAKEKRTKSIVKVPQNDRIKVRQTSPKKFSILPGDIIYPQSSIKLGEEGEVHLQLNYNKLGLPTKVELLKSSGFVSLDQAALLNANGSEIIPKPEKEITQQVTYVFILSEDE